MYIFYLISVKALILHGFLPINLWQFNYWLKSLSTISLYLILRRISWKHVQNCMFMLFIFEEICSVEPTPGAAASSLVVLVVASCTLLTLCCPLLRRSVHRVAPGCQIRSYLSFSCIVIRTEHVCKISIP